MRGVDVRVRGRPARGSVGAAPRASSAGRPIAVSTCDGSVEPVVQADPVEQHRPSRSRACTRAAPSRSRHEDREQCPAAGPWGWPVSVTPSMASTPAASRSRRVRTAADRAAPLGLHQLPCGGHANGTRHVLGARPAMPLLAAAVDLGQDGGAAAQPHHADAPGSLQLVARRPTSGRRPGPACRCPWTARAWTASTWMSARPAGPDAAPPAAARSAMVPTSLLASWSDTRQVRSVSASSSASGSTPAVAVDRQPDDLEAELLEAGAGVQRRPGAPRPWSRCGCRWPCPPTRRP